MLSGRLGLDKTRMPHSARHGLLWLDRGPLDVEAGCLRFTTAVTLRIAFGAVKESASSQRTLEQLVRRHANAVFAKDDVIPTMIDRIKTLMEVPP